MAIYDLCYAEDNLPELFQAASEGEGVIILRGDGIACKLLPLVSFREDETKPRLPPLISQRRT